MYSRARRVLGLSILALIAIPAFVYSYRYVFSPDLYEGDELEERECRYCGGTGKDQLPPVDLPGRSDRCPSCRGRGRVDVITPGPHRPVRVRGLVLNASRLSEPVAALHMPSRRRNPRNPFTKHAAALPGVHVTFTRGDGDSITMTTNDHGRFSTRLRPGTYGVELRADRFSRLKGELTVAPLTAPIWLEKAKIVEPKSPEAARSAYGMELRAVLGRKRGTGEMIVVVASGLW